MIHHTKNILNNTYSVVLPIIFTVDNEDYDFHLEELLLFLQGLRTLVYMFIVIIK